MAHVLFDEEACILTALKNVSSLQLIGGVHGPVVCCTLLLPSCDFGTYFHQLVLHRVNLQGAVLLQQGKCLLLVLKFILCVYVLALFSFCVCALKYGFVCCWWSCCLCCLLIFALMLLFFHSCAAFAMGKNVSACLVVAGLHF